MMMAVQNPVTKQHQSKLNNAHNEMEMEDRSKPAGKSMGAAMAKRPLSIAPPRRSMSTLLPVEL